MIHNIELRPGKGGQMVRSAGGSAQLLPREGEYAQVRLPSGEVRMVSIDCMATIGQVGNVDHENITIGKAGRKRWMGIRPTVRGVAMNPVDHPHGGGEGKTSGGRHPVTPWGQPTRGYKTRNNKLTDRFIVKRREKKAEGGQTWEVAEKGSVCGRPPDEEDRAAQPAVREESGQDLVATVDDCARDGRAHARRPQRQEVHPRVYHREHGGHISWVSSRRRARSRGTA